MTSRILVIVGDEDLSRRLVERLRAQGYAAAAGSLAEAAGEGGPLADLLLLDGALAGVERIWLRLAAHRPLILLSEAGWSDAARNRAQGAAAILRKPVDFDDLDLAVARALELAALRHENQRLHQCLAATPVSFQAEPSLEAIKRDYLRYLLAKYDGHRGKVARILGISERNTYRLIGKFGFGEGGGHG